MNEESTVKTINIPLTCCTIKKKPDKKKSKESTIPKEKVKRQITTTAKWNFNHEELAYENQLAILVDIKKGLLTREHCILVFRQIHAKVYGYRAQDIEKGLLDESQLVDENYIVDLLIKCENNCYYCRKKVDILYEIVRQSNQWTLDRIDNKYGHNKGNVEIACLSCNIRRKTMYHERYVFTKQLVITKELVDNT
jgi:hypothetical protein